MPARNGTRSLAPSSASDRRCTGSPTWLSVVDRAVPREVLDHRHDPADAKPVAAAVDVLGDAAAVDEPALRAPIAGSAGPVVTSASGAKSTLNPSPRQLAAAGCVRRAGQRRVVRRSRRHEGREGRRAGRSRVRRGRPPGPRRPAPASSGRPGRRTAAGPGCCGRSGRRRLMLALNATTPPRCSRFTSLVGAPVPAYDATMTWPARSPRVSLPTRARARAISASGGPSRSRTGRGRNAPVPLLPPCCQVPPEADTGRSPSSRRSDADGSAVHADRARTAAVVAATQVRRAVIPPVCQGATCPGGRGGSGPSSRQARTTALRGGTTTRPSSADTPSDPAQQHLARHALTAPRLVGEVDQHDVPAAAHPEPAVRPR